MIGLDTNVLIRFLVKDDPEQARRAAEIAQECADRGEDVHLDAVVVCETVWVLDRGYGYTRSEISDVLEKILLTQQFHVDERDTAWRALRAYREGKADFADYFIGGRNVHAGCSVTYTFDRALRGTGDFEVL